MMFPPGSHGGGGVQGVDPFQVLFGQGGLNRAGADPQLLEQLFGSGIFAGAPPQQNEPRSSGPPPTGASAMRSLPRIKVSAYDIAALESTECSICLDELVAGQPALRIPCGHLFHEDCVKDWLRKSNECPVCRFELPTDDAEFERGRKERMAGRKIRLRLADLGVRSAQELTRLASYIGVDVRGCLEKSELVDKIAASSRVQIIPVDGAEAPRTNTDPSGLPIFSQQHLDSLSVGEVKALMERLGVSFTKGSDKAEMLRRLVSSGSVLVSREPEAREASRQPATSSSGDAEMRDTQATSPNGGGVSLAGKSVGELRRLATRLGVSLDNCLEKGELVQRIEASDAFHAQRGA